MLFSVIVPIYNKEKYIKYCIESVINQTCSDWELILIDDGSTDKSKDICNRIVKTDDRIHYFYWDNHGIILSRQKGIELAKGKYILHLDADDYWEFNLLERVKEIIEQNYCDIILYRHREVYANHIIKETPLISQQDVLLDHTQKDIFLDIIIEGQPSLCTKAFKTEIVKKDIHKYDKWKNVKLDEDTLQVMTPICRAESLYILNDILYNYRIEDNTMSHGFNKDNLFDNLTVISAQLDILESFDYATEERVKKCYHVFLHAYGCRIRELFAAKISSKERKRIISQIYKSDIYQSIKKYETLENIDVYAFIIIKSFRYKMFFVIRFIGMIKKLLNG